VIPGMDLNTRGQKKLPSVVGIIVSHGPQTQPVIVIPCW